MGGFTLLPLLLASECSSPSAAAAAAAASSSFSWACCCGASRSEYQPATLNGYRTNITFRDFRYCRSVSVCICCYTVIRACCISLSCKSTCAEIRRPRRRRHLAEHFHQYMRNIWTMHVCRAFHVIFQVVLKFARRAREPKIHTNARLFFINVHIKCWFYLCAVYGGDIACDCCPDQFPK